MFFNTLGVPYEYEKEGYDLDGVRYLPDFWLPDQDCFVEIKGQEPTPEEWGKTGALAFNTGKDVFTFFGDVWYDNDTKSAYLDYGVYICAKFGEAFSDEYALRAIAMPCDLVVFLIKLDEARIRLRKERAFHPHDCKSGPFRHGTLVKLLHILPRQ